MKRRDFLKLLGVAGAATMSTSCIETYHWMGTKSRRRYSYLTAKEEEAANGEAYYASTCMECSGSCGVEIRVREGNAVKLEGNSEHPVNNGALCARGQASLARLYDPQRLVSPMIKNAEGKLEEVSWGKAYKAILEALKASKQNYYLSGRTTGSLSGLIDSFCESAKVTKLPEFEPYAHANLRMANKTVFGRDELPAYDIENSDVMLTIGADMLDTFLSPVSHAVQFGKAKARDDWRWLHVEPHLSPSGLKATKRFNVKPQGEVYLLRWLIGKLAKTFKNQLAADLVAKVTLGDEEVLKSGLKIEQLTPVLEALKSAKKPLVVSGGTAVTHETGLEVAVLTALLQWGLGAETLDFANGQDYSGVGTRLDLANTTALLKDKKVDVMFVTRCNPSLHSADFQQQLQNAKFTVGMGLKLDETLSECNVVLPMSHFTESLGDVQPHKGLLNLIQPVAKANNTKQEGDVLLELVNFLDSDTELPGLYEDYLYDKWTMLNPGKPFVQRDFLEKGFHKVDVEEVKLSLDAAASAEFVKNATLAPAIKDGNTLLVIPSLRFFDGRSRDISLLQEIPDTLTTITYGDWVSVAAKTAEALKIKDCDEIEVKSGDFSVKRAAKIQPVMADGILTIQEPHLLGQLGMDKRSGEVLANVYEVSVVKTGKQIPTPILSGSMESRDDGSIYDRHRGINRRGVVPYAYDPHGHGAHDDHKGEHKDDHKDEHHKDDTVTHENHDHKKDEYEHEARKSLYGKNHDEYEKTTGTRSPYRWAMSIDLDTCTGCTACVAACYIENNVAITGPEEHLKGREMSWLRFEPYVYEDQASKEENIELVPVMCQQCENAPCESVCPVYAAYHNPDGLNAQIYNRCVGTRYCANNCPYKVRRFNWFDNGYKGRHLPLHTAHNPDVYVRSKGIMEKCTFCVQRIRVAKDKAKDEKRDVRDGEIVPACAQTCATGAISFGNILDKESKVYKMAHKNHSHRMFDLTGVEPAVYYLGKKGSKDDAGKHG